MTSATPPAPAQKSRNTALIVIVVSVVLVALLGCMGVLAAIAIPNFLRYTQRSEWAMVRMDMTSVAMSQEQFFLSDADADGIEDYAQSLTELDQATGLVGGLASGTNSSGYEFKIVSDSGKSFEESWALEVRPPGGSGRSFYMVQAGEIRVNDDGDAGPNDPVYPGVR